MIYSGIRKRWMISRLHNATYDLEDELSSTRFSVIYPVACGLPQIGESFTNISHVPYGSPKNCDFVSVL